MEDITPNLLITCRFVGIILLIIFACEIFFVNIKNLVNEVPYLKKFSLRLRIYEIVFSKNLDYIFLELNCQLDSGALRNAYFKRVSAT